MACDMPPLRLTGNRFERNLFGSAVTLVHGNLPERRAARKVHILLIECRVHLPLLVNVDSGATHTDLKIVSLGRFADSVASVLRGLGRDKRISFDRSSLAVLTESFLRVNTIL